MSETHIPVLLSAVLTHLIPDGRVIQRVIDGTLGGGGHTRALLAAGVELVLGLDIDPAALVLARQNLRAFGERAVIVQSSYTQMAEQATTLGWDDVDGILLDLGASSLQLDTATRGFSFRLDGPLDMRFDPTDNRPSAADLVNTWDEAELAEIFYQYGEERYRRRIAAAIVRQRPYQTTQQLAAVIAGAMPRPTRRGDQHLHPATRVFQALRIAVNDELGNIERVLPTALRLLRPGGRLAVISFHSLEDRLVKQAFKEATTEVVSPPGMVLAERKASASPITRKPITADETEIAQNPRSRSAKLRVVEKL